MDGMIVDFFLIKSNIEIKYINNNYLIIINKINIYNKIAFFLFIKKLF